MKYTVQIEKLVFGGQALARLPDGRAVFVWNALPGEEVEIEMIKGKKDYAEAVATHIIKASPDRVEAKETAYLSTSPWQMISEDAEAKYKVDIAVETYGRIGGLILQSQKPELVSPKKHFGYRNKMEFSFCELPDGSISLAFFERGKKIKAAVAGSELAEPIINEVAKNVTDWINKQKITNRSLKSLIIRSNGTGQAIAALFIKDELSFSDYPSATEQFKGFHLYYSTHKSPASVPTKLLYSAGDNYLITELLGTKLKFGLLSFFQINIPIFEIALKDIAAFVGPKTPLIDYYSGVGAIGLPLAKNRSETILVDNNKEAIEYAKENISLNNLATCRAECVEAEKMLDIISKDKIIILDPPRAGLHKDVVREIIKKQPERIVYLSCNLSTQARDIQMLSEHYKVSFIKLYNFFPRTPHIEGLCVLEKIQSFVQHNGLISADTIGRD